MPNDNELENIEKNPEEQKPEEQEPKDVRQVLGKFLSHVEQYSGPLPPPDLLIKYNSAFPNAAERIFNLAERQTNHRMDLEKTVVTGDSERADKGLYCGLTVALVGLLVAGFLGYVGQVIPASIIGSIDLVSLVAVFIYGTVSRETERKQKTKSMELVKHDTSGNKQEETDDDYEQE